MTITCKKKSKTKSYLQGASKKIQRYLVKQLLSSSKWTIKLLQTGGFTNQNSFGKCPGPHWLVVGCGLLSLVGWSVVVAGNPRSLRPSDLDVAGAKMAYCVAASLRKRKVRSWHSSMSMAAALLFQKTRGQVEVAKSLGFFVCHVSSFCCDLSASKWQFLGGSIWQASIWTNMRIYIYIHTCDYVCIGVDSVVELRCPSWGWKPKPGKMKKWRLPRNINKKTTNLSQLGISAYYR